MLTPKVSPAGDGLPVAAHDHGPLVGPDDFADAAYEPLTDAQLAACRECGWMGPGCCLAQ